MTRLTGGRRTHRSLEERLAANSIASEEHGLEIDGVWSACWEWTGHRSKDGYGRINFRTANKKKVRPRNAHAVAGELYHGPLQIDMEWGHLCHNEPCIRGEHLAPTTRGDNLNERNRRNGHESRTSARGRASSETDRQEAARDGHPVGAVLDGGL